MGLCLVELVMDVEQAFGIVISNDAAAQMRTVGQLYEYILQRRRQHRTCPTSRAFYAVRRILVENGDVSRRSIRPSVELKTILPAQIRRPVWRSLGKHEWARRLPSLRLPLSLGPVTVGLCLFVAVLAAAMLLPLVGFLNAVLLTVTTTTCVLVLLFVLISPFAVAFPRGIVTVGDLALATLPPGHEGAARKPWSDGEVWEKLRAMVAEDLGVKLEEVVPTARLVEDLGGG